MESNTLGIVADSLTVDSVVRPEKTQEELVLEQTRSSEDRALRPHTLEDYIGQEEAKEQLSIALKAARMRGEALDHVLILDLQVLARPLFQILLPMSLLYQFLRPQVLLLRKKVMLQLY